MPLKNRREGSKTENINPIDIGLQSMFSYRLTVFPAKKIFLFISS